MKKNVLMRAASGLLVATMLTTCAISGTFAKYVTQDKGGDMARVAKWGVVVQVEGDLYGTNYLDTPNNYATDTDAAISVQGKQIGSALTNVVAPGTKSEGAPFTFGINGTPEVDSKTTIQIDMQNIYLKEGTYGVMVKAAVSAEDFDELKAHAEGDLNDGLYQIIDDSYQQVPSDAVYSADNTYFTLEDYVVYSDGTDDNKFYYPVVYTMTGTGEADTNTSYGSIEAGGVAVKQENTLATISNLILSQVDDTIDADDWTVVTDTDGVYRANASVHVEHNQDLTDVLNLGAQKIAWEWEFHDHTAEPGATDNADIHEDIDHNISLQDKLDTILGNLMAERVALQGGDTFDGVVVKFDTENTRWITPAEVDGANVNDFCLDTQFDICILTEQED